MRFINLESCTPGMIVSRDIVNNGVTFLRAGKALKESYIKTLDNLGYKGCYIEDDFSKYIKMTETISPAVRNEAITLAYEIFSVSKPSQNMIQKQLMESVNDILDDIVDQIIRNRDESINIISLKSFDLYTYQHSVDVSVMAVFLGKEYGLVRSQLIELGKSAFFHDIGKAFISQTILNKPDKLTPEEFEEIKLHPEMGFDYLKDILYMSKNICESALYHHEKFSGGGYPKGLSGKEIPLFSRIIAIADTYDAITSKRPYKEAMIASEAYEYIMAASEIQFDPELVQLFVKKVAPFPIGTTVRLSNNLEGVVKENNSNVMMRPIIQLFNKKEEQSDDEAQIEKIDQAEKTDKTKQEEYECLDLSDPKNSSITIVAVL